MKNAVFVFFKYYQFLKMKMTFEFENWNLLKTCSRMYFLVIRHTVTCVNLVPLSLHDQQL